MKFYFITFEIFMNFYTLQGRYRILKGFARLEMHFVGLKMLFCRTKLYVVKIKKA
jgi:hypothetical protein